MRRVMLILLALVLSPIAKGQLLVSGDVGYEHITTGYTQRGLEAYNGNLPNGHLFTVSARVGYGFGDKVEIGVKPSITWSLYVYKTGDYSDNTKRWEALSQLKKDWLLYSIAPYVRLRILHFGDLSVCAEMTADIAWGKGSEETTEYSATYGNEVVMNTDADYRRWALLLAPVVNYRLGQHWSVDLYLNMLTLGYSNTLEKVSLINSDKEDHATTTSAFGVSVAANRGTLLSVGFAYRF